MTVSEGVMIEVEPREGRGSSEAGRLRRSGRIPGVVYGGGKETVPVSVDAERLDAMLRHAGQRIFKLRISTQDEGGDAMIKEMQTDPISGRPLHIDFIRIERGHKVQVTVPIVLDGDCVGVREGGRVDFVSRELDVEVLPKDMIEELRVDISELHAGEHLTVADIASLLPPSGRFVEDAHRLVVMVEKPRSAEAEAAAEAEEAAASGPAEPELIRTRGKAEEE
jgi:large subunit ribosomal protein L25